LHVMKEWRLWLGRILPPIWSDRRGSEREADGKVVIGWDG
jgi:hypothetical protein